MPTGRLGPSVLPKIAIKSHLNFHYFINERLIRFEHPPNLFQFLFLDSGHCRKYSQTSYADQLHINTCSTTTTTITTEIIAYYTLSTVNVLHVVPYSSFRNSVYQFALFFSLTIICALFIENVIVMARAPLAIRQTKCIHLIAW